MTLKEYQEWHYKLWDYIAYRILQDKECLSIAKLKSEWIQANYIGDVCNDCFICDYLLSSPDSCKECANILGYKETGHCLGGLYYDCIYSDTYIDEYKIACEIRDIWRGKST